MANRILISVQEEIDSPLWLDNVEPFVDLVMEKFGFDGEEISILFCNDDYIRELNKNFRGIDSATDVLSFENGDEYEDEEGVWKCAGDIAISLDTLPVNAAYFEQTENDEIKRLLVHGLLHLNGYDHEPEHIEKGVEPVCEMLVKQENLLKELKNESVIK
ncbi:rRNA maturation RNase YbeY [Treponema sp. C6A8]|uniref:rRNA maturation RNase YbeY n=1 Tax=Treponema sp. C6A8 TaxID=1410609 RepID=UPI000482F668|nr:rRNA maturation RNase YbeY [Treponema sp. C6A8]